MSTWRQAREKYTLGSFQISTILRPLRPYARAKWRSRRSWAKTQEQSWSMLWRKIILKIAEINPATIQWRLQVHEPGTGTVEAARHSCAYCWGYAESTEVAVYSGSVEAKTKTQWRPSDRAQLKPLRPSVKALRRPLRAWALGTVVAAEAMYQGTV
jgi:hypothetical protein